MRQVEIAGLALEESTGAPLVVLQETDAPYRVVPIFVGGTEAAAIGLALAGETPERPLTYDVMADLMDSLDARVERVEVTELRDGAFLAELAVTGPRGDRRLDTRPSDAIALAMHFDAPLFVSDAVLDAAGTTPDVDDDVELLDDEDIDSEVAAFRAELDLLLPADFGTDLDDE
jgi:bifunctional DNase/RNase